MNDDLRSGARASWTTGWPGAVLASLAVLALCLFMSSRTSLWDRDEGWYCRAAAEMVASGQYLYPTYNDKPFLEKPILTYWLMAGAMKVLGPTELACRFFSAVGMAISCLLTWWIGRRLFDARTGLWALAVMATSLMVLIVGQLAFTDCIMLPCLLGAVAVFASALKPCAAPSGLDDSSPLTGGSRPRLPSCRPSGPEGSCGKVASSSPAQVGIWHFIALALTTGLTMLAKGPMGLVPLAIIGTALWLARKRTPRLQSLQVRENGTATDTADVAVAAAPVGVKYFLWCCLAVGFGCAMYAAWAVAVNNATGGEYFRSGIAQHVVGRVAAPMQGHGGKSWKYVAFLPFYVPVVLIGFYPWVLHLPGAISALLGGRLGGRVGRAFILANILPLLIAMTLAATKLPHYILPIWLGLALAVAATIQAWRTGSLTDRDKLWLRRGVWLLGPMGAIGGLALLIGPFVVAGLSSLRPGGVVVGAMTLALTAGAVKLHLARGPLASAKLLLAGMVATVIAWALLAAPGVEQLKGVPRLARQVKAATSAQTPVAAYGFDEPSLHFYLRRHIEPLNNKRPDAVIAWLATPGQGVLILPAKNLKLLEDAGYRQPAKTTIASVHMLNLGKFGWVDVLAIWRR